MSLNRLHFKEDYSTLNTVVFVWVFDKVAAESYAKYTELSIISDIYTYNIDDRYTQNIFWERVPYNSFV